MTSLPNKLPGYREDLSVYQVSQCPDNETTWKASATTLGCNVDYNNKDNPFRHYYCLPTQSKSELVHFCYDKYSHGIQKGACLVLGNNGDLRTDDCQNFENGCPDKPYLSETIYRFQACLEINNEQRCYLAVKGCLPSTSKTIITPSTEGPATSVILSTTTNDSVSETFTEMPAVGSTLSKFLTSTPPTTEFDTDDHSNYTAIIKVVVLLVLVAIGGLVIFMRWKKKAHRRKQLRMPQNGIENYESDENGVHVQLVEEISGYETELKITGNQSVMFGSSARFMSTVTYNQDPSSVKWQKGDGDTFTDIEISDEKYAGSTADPNHPVLVINKVDFSDTATFRLMMDHVCSNGIQLHVTGYLELIFDFLSRKLPPAEISLFEASLLNETQLAEAANMHSHRNPANTYFKIIYTWKCRNPSLNHIKKLREKLSEMQRQDLLDDMDDFKITNYKYSNVIGSGSCLKTKDFMTIATHLATDYLHLVRFLGLPHRTIEHIETDHHTVNEHIFQCLVQLKRSKPSVTRQDLCDGLVYADHQEVAAILNEKWGNEMSV